MITLIGRNLAKEGLIFINYGASKKCETCRFKSSCLDSLDEGRMYVIKDIKDIEHPCPIHEGGKVKVIDVEKADIEALVTSKGAFEGSTVVFDAPDCDEDCSMKYLCFPEGLYQNDKCRIVKVIGRPKNKCVKGLNLNLVLLRLI